MGHVELPPHYDPRILLLFSDGETQKVRDVNARGTKVDGKKQSWRLEVDPSASSTDDVRAMREYGSCLRFS